MEVIRRVFESKDGLEVPAFHVSAGKERAVLVVHGYSSSKSEWLGFSYELAEKGADVFAIDLRGHGDNPNPLDENVLADVEGAIEVLREEYGKVYAVGHSLGALLSLSSSADFVYAISPPLSAKLPPEPVFMLRLNSCRVREKDDGVLFRILEKYTPPERNGNAVVFYGKGESKGIQMGIKAWAEGRNVRVVEVGENQATLPEIEVDAEKLKNYLPNFTSHLSVVAARKIVEEIRF
ncbi:Alpha/beta hydrolase family [Geoglobus ahangari]|uniref:Alpha/beta hydrolase family n=1 Tax=Geoglobus ahangari TaxID=113653 RepID=A0A0F7DBR1_9EURY|nr:alpha/beta fold hydrolase [Geoglobus ahangari]AKG91531.1 Alpha/beta hydrolase family [Geoglobus ahangari]